MECPFLLYYLISVHGISFIFIFYTFTDLSFIYHGYYFIRYYMILYDII